MMRKETGIYVHREKNFAVQQKRYDTLKARAIVDTQVVRDIVGDVLQRGCVSVARKEIAKSY
jgi:hypothetical protein